MADLIEGDDELVEYDLAEWDDDARGALELMLRGQGVAYEWDDGDVLLVPEADEGTVDGFLAWLSSGASPLDQATSQTEEEQEEEDDDDLDSAFLDVDQFYDADPRRHASAEVELGLEWTDERGVEHELSWIEDTGELFITTADGGQGVEVLGVWTERDEVEKVLDGWEAAMGRPHSLAWLRQRVGRGTASASAAPDAGGVAGDDDVWFRPPEALEWLTPALEDLARAYFEWRANLGPDDALDDALKEVLDPRRRLALLDHFVEEGAQGVEPTTRTRLRDALERRMLPPR